MIVDKRCVIILLIYLGVLVVLEVTVLVVRYIRDSKPMADEENQLSNISTDELRESSSEVGGLQSVDEQENRRALVRDPSGLTVDLRYGKEWLHHVVSVRKRCEVKWKCV